jgi:hypothetical protein
MQMHWFERRHLQLLLEMQANERDSLNIGLYMLDKNLTGTLTCHSQPLEQKHSRDEREREESRWSARCRSLCCLRSFRLNLIP